MIALALISVAIPTLQTPDWTVSVRGVSGAALSDRTVTDVARLLV